MCILEVLVPQRSLGTSSKTVETHTALLMELGVHHSPQQERPALSHLLSSMLPNCFWVTLEDPIIGKIPGFPEHLICSFCDHARRHNGRPSPNREPPSLHLRDEVTPTIDSSCLSFCTTTYRLPWCVPSFLEKKILIRLKCFLQETWRVCLMV